MDWGNTKKRRQMTVWLFCREGKQLLEGARRFLNQTVPTTDAPRADADVVETQRTQTFKKSVTAALNGNK